MAKFRLIKLHAYNISSNINPIPQTYYFYNVADLKRHFKQYPNLKYSFTKIY